MCVWIRTNELRTKCRQEYVFKNVPKGEQTNVLFIFRYVSGVKAFFHSYIGTYIYIYMNIIFLTFLLLLYRK